MSRLSTSGRGALQCDVLTNDGLCDDHYRIALSVPHFPPTRPGQFVQIQCRRSVEQLGARIVDWPQGRWPQIPQGELTDAEPLLRRPMSLAGRRAGPGGSVELHVIYHCVGAGTRWLASVRPGDTLSVLGPLGNAFAIRDDRPVAALVGGGVGIPPLLYLAESLAKAGKCSVAFAGARTASLLPLGLSAPDDASRDGSPSLCVAEFAAHDIAASVSTDDGTLGFAGLVSEPFRRWLDGQGSPGENIVVYCCGPEAMMQVVGEICVARGVECQLSLERHMACGMGTCQSCICRVRTDDARGWTYKLCCTHGPVFDAREVVWDRPDQ